VSVVDVILLEQVDRYQWGSENVDNMKECLLEQPKFSQHAYKEGHLIG